MNWNIAEDTITDEQKELYIQRLCVSLIVQEPVKQPVINFDVNKNEELLVCVNGIERQDSIYVYAKDGSFEFGLQFHQNGSFGAIWEGEDILLYRVRSDLAFLIGRNGIVKEVRPLKESSRNSMYMSTIRERIQTDEHLYIMKNKSFLLNFTSKFSMIMRTDKYGSVEMIYDASSQQERTVARWIIIGAIVFVFWSSTLVATLIVSRKFRRRMPKPFGIKPVS